MDFFSRLLLSGNTKVAACPTAQIYLFAPLAAEGPEGICFRGCVFITCWALHGCDLKDESLANHPTPENFEIGRICTAGFVQFQNSPTILPIRSYSMLSVIST